MGTGTPGGGRGRLRFVNDRDVARTLAAARAGFGVVFLAAPALATRRWLGPPSSLGSVKVFTRAIGARDLTLSSACCGRSSPANRPARGFGLARRSTPSTPWPPLPPSASSPRRFASPSWRWASAAQSPAFAWPTPSTDGTRQSSGRSPGRGCSASSPVSVPSCDALGYSTGRSCS